MEWRTPRVTCLKIDHYIIYYKSLEYDETYLKEKVFIVTANASDIYRVNHVFCLRNKLNIVKPKVQIRNLFIDLVKKSDQLNKLQRCCVCCNSIY